MFGMDLDAKSLFLMFYFVCVYADGMQRGLLHTKEIFVHLNSPGGFLVSLNIKIIPVCNSSFPCPGPALSLSCFVSFPCLSYFSLERLLSMFLGTYVL